MTVTVMFSEPPAGEALSAIVAGLARAGARLTFDNGRWLTFEVPSPVATPAPARV